MAGRRGYSRVANHSTHARPRWSKVVPLAACPAVLDSQARGRYGPTGVPRDLGCQRSVIAGPVAVVFYAMGTTLAYVAHRWRLTKASSTTDRRLVTCSCGRWRGFTETEADAQRLAGQHGHPHHQDREP